MKKNMKKVMALALAASMTLGMTTAALAATGDQNTKGSIEIENQIAETDYAAYKIFDVEYNEDAYAYTISSTSAWFSTVEAYAKVAANGLTLTKAASADVYVISVTKAFNAANFSNELYKALENVEATGIEFEGDKLENLDLGYYFVTSGAGALCNLTTTNPDVTIYDKNEVIFDKTDDQSTVEVGQTVNYEINGKVPDTTGFITDDFDNVTEIDEYVYYFTDEMSEGLTFQEDIKVYIDKDLIADNYYRATYTNNGFRLDIKVADPHIQEEYKGKEIVVKYSAVVNENAVAKVEKNAATITYTNKPGSFETSKPNEETVYSAKIVIDKVIKDTETPLAGAKFVLYKEVKEDGATEATKMYYAYNAVAEDVSWTNDITAASEYTTDKNGAAEFVGLADGTYYLLETEAPTGYNLLKDPVKVEVDGKGVEAEVEAEKWVDYLVDTAKVENETGAILPSTGGIGTTIFYVLGSLLVAFSGVVLFAKKRMRGEF